MIAGANQNLSMISVSESSTASCPNTLEQTVSGMPCYEAQAASDWGPKFENTLSILAIM